ncbi:S8 family serine peptidase [Pleionea sp. CnH1-48]|uniref:S8 family serine peptidase n=1 Tax=Pleionea sp. CnH1-48 TaxID=2954494 RepID=UPI002097DC3D|nr:S8 family serine peptidase [Pleionea sp. CnH1-48]MCO7225380.1 S8 family serine peptidase [Pleionea sp. CnH1-48]
MKNKVALAVAAALLSPYSLSVLAESDSGNAQVMPDKGRKYSGKVQHNERSTYMVELVGDPLANYKGSVKGLNAVQSSANKVQRGSRLITNYKSAASVAYKQHLLKQQTQVLVEATRQFKRSISPSYQYQYAFNGFAVELTPSEARKLEQLPEVKQVSVSKPYHLHTDRGPTLINAPSVWDGTATGVAAKGEGMVVGIIDTGINTDHPSFAEVDPVDGYVHVNPLGANVFLGECVNDASLCNNKLIGAYNMVSGENSPEDADGHGTHVASTAAGNHLSFDLGNGNSYDLSGVAPRANIIAYKVENAQGTIDPPALVAAIDQAVADNVDVINYSIGASAPFANPWNDSDSIAFKNARNAGVFVATSAGNDGSGATTVGSPANAPWITSVAASTHDRGDYPGKSMSNFSGGSSTPGTMNGTSLTGSITASIVYAGDFDNSDPNPEQCLSPFPANTFSGQIVVCDRGEIARVEKAVNVQAGGAGGYVLANVSGGSTSLNDDIYVIPGIHISSADGDTLKSWLSSGAGHTATINGTTGPVGVDAAAADIVAGFSSRGPTGFPQGIMKPSVAAPGVSIYAADVGPVEYGFKSGTSMASPHVAGAGALLKQLNPTWTPGQIHSALMTTGIVALKKENGTTDADANDIGGGRIDIPAAAKAGLLLDVTDAQFMAADPAASGDPSALNLPGLADHSCVVNCSWTRNLTAVGANTWNVSFENGTGMTLSANSSSFTLAQNASQSLDVTANVVGVDGEWAFGSVLLTPTNNTHSVTRLPVATRISNSNLPSTSNLSGQRDGGSFTFENIEIIAESTVTTTGHLVAASTVTQTISQDSDNNSPYDDLNDGVFFQTITVPASSEGLIVETHNSTAADMDLFVGFDSNNDGQPSEGEEIARSTTGDANEQIILNNPTGGSYWILVQNWDDTNASGDTISISSGALGTAASNALSFTAPSSSDGATPADITMTWSGLDTEDSRYYGKLSLGRTAGGEELGRSLFSFVRGSNDVSIAASNTAPATGTDFTYTITLDHDGSDTRNYTLSATIPNGITVNASSLTNGATLNGSTLSWSGAVAAAAQTVSFTAQGDASLAGQAVVLNVEHDNDATGTTAETASVTVNFASSGGGNGNGNNNNSGGGGGGAMSLLLLPLLLLRGRRRR